MTVSPTFRLLVLVSLLFASSQLAFSQVAVRIATAKRNYLVGERVEARIEITNNAGRDLTFTSRPQQSWLQISVQDSRGNDLISRNKGVFQSGKIGANQTISRSVSLTSLFNMSGSGNYRFSAAVIPDGDSNAYRAAGDFVSVTQGATLFKETRGIPGSDSDIRELSLVSYDGHGDTRLYAQVTDPKSGIIRATKDLGPTMTFPAPMARVDNIPNLHTLYRVTPDHYNYVVTDLKGAVVKSARYTKGSAQIRLEKFGNGEVVVAGGIVFDQEAESIRKTKIRKITDRPSTLFN